VASQLESLRGKEQIVVLQKRKSQRSETKWYWAKWYKKRH
jgi:hypothetical protein